MKLVISTLTLVFSTSAFANDIPEYGFCFEKAESAVMALHDHIRFDVYSQFSEQTQVTYSNRQYQIDHLDEFFVFDITTTNTNSEFEQDFTTRYEVDIEAWLSADTTANPHDCMVLDFRYIGRID